MTRNVPDMERLSTALVCVIMSLATRGRCVTSLAVPACSSSTAADEVGLSYFFLQFSPVVLLKLRILKDNEIINTATLIRK